MVWLLARKRPKIFSSASETSPTVARRRIAFEELLLYQVALSLLRSDARKGVKLSFADEDVEDFWKLLPFPPTNAQKRALYEMARDLRMDAPMARLLEQPGHRRAAALVAQRAGQELAEDVAHAQGRADHAEGGEAGADELRGFRFHGIQS